MISLLVTIVVLGLVYWLLTLLPLPDPFGVILKVVFVLIAIWVILGAFGLVSSPSLGSGAHLR